MMSSSTKQALSPSEQSTQGFTDLPQECHKSATNIECRICATVAHPTAANTCERLEIHEDCK
eukprot:4803017-Amphidinium_carterae.2